jgi:hypothetical protein
MVTRRLIAIVHQEIVNSERRIDDPSGVRDNTNTRR